MGKVCGWKHPRTLSIKTLLGYTGGALFPAGDSDGAILHVCGAWRGKGGKAPRGGRVLFLLLLPLVHSFFFLPFGGHRKKGVGKLHYDSRMPDRGCG